MIFRLLNGVIQFVFSLYWVILCFQLLNNDHFAGMLYSVMYPEWLLIFGMVLSIIGIGMSFLVLFDKITIKKGYLIIMLLWILGIIVEILSSQI